MATTNAVIQWRRRPLALAISILGSACLGTLLPLSVQAQESPSPAEQQYAFDIGPGALADVLSRFASAAGVALSFEAASLEQRMSPGLQGRFSIEQGFAQLLQGSGLYADGQQGSYVLIPVDTQAGRFELSAIGISDQRREDPSDLPYRSAGSSSYIGAKALERFRGTSAGDIFKTIPGVFNTTNRASPALDLNIRGLQGFNRVPVRLDGASGSSDLESYYASRSNRSFIDPDIIGSLEVHKGPQANAEGVGAIGGVVSARTLVIDDFVEADKDFGLRVKLGSSTNNVSPPSAMSAAATSFYAGRPGYSLNDNHDSRSRLGGYNGSVALGARFEWVDLVAVLAQREQGNYFAGRNGKSTYQGFYRPIPLSAAYPKGSEVFNTSQDSESLLLKATLKFSPQQHLELGYLDSQHRFGEVHPFNSGYGVQYGLSSNDATTLTARYRWNPAELEWLDLKANAWQRKTRGKRDGLAHNLGTLAANQRYQIDGWGADVSNRTLLFSDSLPLTLDYGLSYSKETFRNPVYLGAIRQPANDSWSESGFFKSRWEPVAWLAIEGSLRHDRFKQLGQGTYEGSGAGRTQRPVREEETSPSLSLILSPLPGLQFYAQHTRGARMISNYELLQATSGANSTSQGTMAPERTRNVEFGINLSLDDVLLTDDRLRGKLARFDNNIANYFIWTSPQTDADAHFAGSELSLDYDSPRFFSNMAVTYYETAKVCSYGRRKAFQGSGSWMLPGCSKSVSAWSAPPRLSGGLTLGGRWFDQRLEVGTRGYYRGLILQQGDTGNASFPRGKPTTIWDAFASVRFSDSTTLDLNLENMTDRYYLDYDPLFENPSPGRTLRLGLTHHFF